MKAGVRFGSDPVMGVARDRGGPFDPRREARYRGGMTTFDLRRIAPRSGAQHRAGVEVELELLVIGGHPFTPETEPLLPGLTGPLARSGTVL